MNLEDVKLSSSPLTDEVYIGIIDAKNLTWKTKKNVTSDFLNVMVDKFLNKETIITSDSGKKYEIILKEI